MAIDHTTAQTTTTLLTLPKDVRTLIVSHLRRKTDRRNVYRTCTALYEVAIPQSYQRIVVDQHCNIEQLTAAFSPENEGLQHVRHAIIVTHGAGGNDDTVKDKINMIVRLFAYMLPRDVLLTFT